MNNERLYQVLQGPVFSEKAQVLGDTAGVQVFKVALNANKLEIKKAVEKKFEVKVVKVATMNRLGKTKQMTVRSGGRTIRTTGKRSNWKKAVVTLETGNTIDLMGGEEAN